MRATPIPAEHGPGWEHDGGHRRYLVWAPREGRERWSAAWESARGMHGEFRRGESLEAVLMLFPAAVRPVFRRAVAGDQAATRSCDWLTGYGLPGDEKCGQPAVGKWHAQDDEWFCAKHIKGVQES